MNQDKDLSKKISDIIYNHLYYMYCDNCRFFTEDKSNLVFDKCKNCSNRNNSWGISRRVSDDITNEIIELLGGNEFGNN